MQIRFKQIKTKLFISLLLVGIVSISIIGYISFYNAQKTLKDVTFSFLQAVSESRKLSIQGTIDFRKEQIAWDAENFFIKQLSSDGDTDNDSIEKIQEQIELIFAGTNLIEQNNHNIDSLDSLLISINVWDVDGVIVASTDVDTIRQEIPRDLLLKTEKDKPLFLGPEKDEITGESSFLFAHLVTNIEDDKVSGGISLIIKYDILGRIMSNRFGLGETGEVYAINNDYLMVTESRFVEDAILNQKVDTEVSRKCINGESTTGVYQDYRGVFIVGHAQYIESIDWCLLTEIDETEIFSGINTLRNLILALGFAILLFIIALSLFLSRLITDPINKLRKGVEAIEKGDLTYKIETNSSDEVGYLSRSFNSLIEKFHDQQKTLGEKVKERTSDLESANRIMTGRESRVIELKEENKRLKKEVGKNQKPNSNNTDFYDSNI
jgi:HAMP domain-containing protein